MYNIMTIKKYSLIIVVVYLLNSLAVDGSAPTDIKLRTSQGKLAKVSNTEYKLYLDNNSAAVKFKAKFPTNAFGSINKSLFFTSNEFSASVFVQEGRDEINLVVNSGDNGNNETYKISTIREPTPKKELSTPVLVMLIDLDNTEMPTSYKTSKTAENLWSELIFGNKQGQGNHYWNEVSNGQFKMIPATENSGIKNNGVIHIKLKGNQFRVETNLRKIHAEFKRHRLGQGVSNRYNLSEGDWVGNALELASRNVRFRQYDKNHNNVIENSELSLLMVFNLNSMQLKGARAQANISLNYKVGGITIEKFARTLADFSSIGVNMHELGHHIFDLEHSMEPKSFSLMGSGAYNEDPSIGTFTNHSFRSGTRPAHPTGYSKAKASFVIPVLINDTTFNIKLHKQTSPLYNLIKLPVLDGFLYMENRQPEGYDSGVPFYQLKGGIFSQEVIVAESSLRHKFEAEDYEIEDFQSVKGHHDDFLIGGFRIFNVSKSADVMTFDIVRQNLRPKVKNFFLNYWTHGDSKGYRKRTVKPIKPFGTISIDYQSFPDVNRFVSIEGIYNTGEIRDLVDSKWSTTSKFIQVKKSLMNRDQNGIFHIMMVDFSTNQNQRPTDSALIAVKYKAQTFNIELTNLQNKVLSQTD